MAAECRKARKSNFSYKENEILFGLVMQHRDILCGENAKNILYKETRNEVWEQILQEVNKVARDKRTLAEVKSKWKRFPLDWRPSHANIYDANEPILFHQKDFDELAHLYLSSIPSRINWKVTFPMKTKKTAARNYVPTVPHYDAPFKKSVILCAEKKGNREAKLKFGVSDSNIKRWRNQKDEIFFEESQLNLRRSERTSTTSKSKFQENSDTVKVIRLQDSMPLQQRLSQSSSTDELQSQALSPTKLKVTRQATRQQQNTLAAGPMLPPLIPTVSNSQICLKWDSHHSNMQTAFPNLLSKEQYVDTTLVSEGKTLKCHKMILSSCSPYFAEILADITPFQHPVLFMNEIQFWILKALCDFMYAGEVHISQNKLRELLTAAETLKIKGLASISQIKDEPQLFTPTTEIKNDSDVSDQQPQQQQQQQLIKSSQEKSSSKEDYGTKKREDGRKSKTHQEEASPSNSQKHLRKMAYKVGPKSTHVAKETAKVPSERRSLKHIVKADGDKSKQLPKRNIRNKSDSIFGSSKEKGEKHNESTIDFLELVKPIYEEEVTKDNITTTRTKQLGLMKKGLKKLPSREDAPVTKRINKRRFMDYNQSREESPSPTFQLRKGTRSRPNAKIRKFYDYEDVGHSAAASKNLPIATIVREPHTNRDEPLIDEIKAEPIDVEENSIVVEENMLENYLPEDEEIMGNYDSPIVNIKRENVKEEKVRRHTPNIFKKHTVQNPVILNVHTVVENENLDKSNTKDEGQKNIQIIDMTISDDVPSPNSRQIRRDPDPLLPTLTKQLNVNVATGINISKVESINVSKLTAAVAALPKIQTVTTATATKLIPILTVIKQEMKANEAVIKKESADPPQPPTVIDILSSSDDEAGSGEEENNIKTTAKEVNKQNVVVVTKDLLNIAKTSENVNKSAKSDNIKQEAMEIDDTNNLEVIKAINKEPTIMKQKENEADKIKSKTVVEVVVQKNQSATVAAENQQQTLKETNKTALKKEFTLVENNAECLIELKDDDEDEHNTANKNVNTENNENLPERNSDNVTIGNSGNVEPSPGTESPIELHDDDDEPNVTNKEQVLKKADEAIGAKCGDKLAEESKDAEQQLSNADNPIELQDDEDEDKSELAKDQNEQSNKDGGMAEERMPEIQSVEQQSLPESIIELKDDDDDSSTTNDNKERQGSEKIIDENLIAESKSSEKHQQVDSARSTEEISILETIQSQLNKTDADNNETKSGVADEQCENELEIIDCDLIPETNNGNRLPITTSISSPSISAGTNHEKEKIVIQEYLSINLQNEQGNVIVTSPNRNLSNVENIQEREENRCDESTNVQQEIMELHEAVPQETEKENLNLTIEDLTIERVPQECEKEDVNFAVEDFNIENIVNPENQATTSNSTINRSDTIEILDDNIKTNENLAASLLTATADDVKEMEVEDLTDITNTDEVMQPQQQLENEAIVPMEAEISDNNYQEFPVETLESVSHQMDIGDDEHDL